MRTRLIVAFAALIAASALVAVPEPAGSRMPSQDRSIDPAQLSAVSLGLSAGSPAASTTFNDSAASTSRVEPESALVEPGSAVITRRPSVRQPAAPRGSISKNVPEPQAAGGWRFDPNISWYGPGLYGNGTACGQKLTKDLVGVAHRTLPCGTIVTFRYKGKTVSAPVIDRGPYAAGRTWDLSNGLCRLLDHCFTGTIEWKLGG
ncbi:MAG TPA: septal ring lytic transglycosylase RlpA family protein [Candidatus Limnocylindrales bacterium]|nr:septal ring lytic transglycosylase RlpA family protein [Candidatus Limnocylindrales bacterium]